MTAPTSETATLPDPSSPSGACWRHTLGGTWRLTYPRFLTPAALGIFAALLGLLALLAYSIANDTGDLHYATWTTQFYLAFLVPTLAFVTSAGLIRDDMKPDTVDYVLTRPVRRHTFILQRYLAHNACLQLLCLLAVGVLVAVGLFRHVPGASGLAAALLPAQVSAIASFGALGFAFGAFTGRFVILGLLYAVVIEIGIGNIPTQLNRLALGQHIRALARGEHTALSLITLFAAALALLVVAATVYSLRDSAAKPTDA